MKCIHCEERLYEDNQDCCDYCHHEFCQDCIDKCEICDSSYCQYCAENSKHKCIICNTFCHIERDVYLCEICKEDYYEEVEEILSKYVNEYNMKKIFHVLKDVKQYNK